MSKDADEDKMQYIDENRPACEARGENPADTCQVAESRQTRVSALETCKTSSSGAVSATLHCIHTRDHTSWFVRSAKLADRLAQHRKGFRWKELATVSPSI